MKRPLLFQQCPKSPACTVDHPPPLAATQNANVNVNVHFSFLEHSLTPCRKNICLLRSAKKMKRVGGITIRGGSHGEGDEGKGMRGSQS